MARFLPITPCSQTPALAFLVSVVAVVVGIPVRSSSQTREFKPCRRKRPISACRWRIYRHIPLPYDAAHLPPRLTSHVFQNARLPTDSSESSTEYPDSNSTPCRRDTPRGSPARSSPSAEAGDASEVADRIPREDSPVQEAADRIPREDNLVQEPDTGRDAAARSPCARGSVLVTAAGGRVAVWGPFLAAALVGLVAQLRACRGDAVAC